MSKQQKLVLGWLRWCQGKQKDSILVLDLEEINKSVGGKNLSSQLQNATSKFSGKFQINVIKLIKLDDDMCHPKFCVYKEKTYKEPYRQYINWGRVNSHHMFCTIIE